jgi:hypothetical protein
MPTTQYPGVYLVEVESSVRPIEGVSTSTAGWLATDVVDRLRRRLQGGPDWTDANVHDPGITLLEALTSLTESWLVRGDPLAEPAARHLSRLVAASLHLLADRPLPDGSALRRVCRVTDRADAADGESHPER